MKKLVVSAFVEKGQVQLLLDGRELSSPFPIQLDLKEDNHVLQWFVHALGDTQFTLSISSPKSAEMQLTKRLGKGDKDWGGVGF